MTDVSISDLEKELKEYLVTEDRQDSGFRLSIALSQFGSLSSHYNHDSKENPRARPYGTINEETSNFGHAIIQLLIYGISRGLPVIPAIEQAMVNIRDRDWIIRAPSSSLSSDNVVGEIACEGVIEGIAFNAALGEPPDVLHGNKIILVAKHPKNIYGNYSGIVTDHGGIGCHAAIIARERKIPCIVGTGNASSRIPHGSIIKIIACGEKGTVEIITSTERTVGCPMNETKNPIYRRIRLEDHRNTLILKMAEIQDQVDIIDHEISLTNCEKIT